MLQGLLEKTTTKSSLFQRNFSMFALTWITEKELERVKKKVTNFVEKKKHENSIAAVRK